MEGDQAERHRHGSRNISIHALRVEGDAPTPKPEPARPEISIHALRVEGDRAHQGSDGQGQISIHALRVEGDPVGEQVDAEHGISIHALRVEGDLSEQMRSCAGSPFQSTPSVWRATRSVLVPPEMPRFQSTPSVWRATLSLSSIRASTPISIHALRVEGDGGNGTVAHLYEISIHALRVEGDARASRSSGDEARFQSTPSVWRATHAGDEAALAPQFQSTPSVWRATEVVLRAFLGRFRFQSTPSVWRATSRAPVKTSRQTDFNPRPPCGGRPTVPPSPAYEGSISIHALRVEGDASS